MGPVLAAFLALLLAPGSTFRVVATAYCHPGKTQSGVRVRVIRHGWNPKASTDR